MRVGESLNDTAEKTEFVSMTDLMTSAKRVFIISMMTTIIGFLGNTNTRNFVISEKTLTIKGKKFPLTP